MADAGSGSNQSQCCPSASRAAIERKGQYPESTRVSFAEDSGRSGGRAAMDAQLQQQLALGASCARAPRRRRVEAADALSERRQKYRARDRHSARQQRRNTAGGRIRPPKSRTGGTPMRCATPRPPRPRLSFGQPRADILAQLRIYSVCAESRWRPKTARSRGAADLNSCRALFLLLFLPTAGGGPLEPQS